MNNKLSAALLAGTTLVVSTVMPVFADTAPAKQSCDKTNVNISQATPRTGRIERHSNWRGHTAFAGKARFRHGGMFSHLKGEDALTAQQYEELFTVKNQFLDQLGPKLSTLFASKREMRDLITQPTIDTAKVEALQAKIDSESNAVADLKLQDKLSQLSVLTDTQKKDLRAGFVKAAVNGRFGMRV